MVSTLIELIEGRKRSLLHLRSIWDRSSAAPPVETTRVLRVVVRVVVRVVGRRSLGGEMLLSDYMRSVLAESSDAQKADMVGGPRRDGSVEEKEPPGKEMTLGANMTWGGPV